MKLLLINKLDVRKKDNLFLIHSGVYKKMLDLKEAFFESNIFSKVDVASVYYEDVFINESKSHVEETINKKYNKKISFFDQIKMRNEGWKKVYTISSDYDYIYIRYSSDIYIYNLLLKEKNKYFITEVFTNAKATYRELLNDKKIKKSKKFSLLARDLFLRNLIYKKTNVIFLIGEMSFYEKKYFNKVVLFNNGINVKDYKIKKDRIKDKQNIKNINLIGVAHINFWHGFDRILEGMKNYYKRNPEIIVNFNIVGEGEELSNLKKLVNKYNLNKYVFFLGYKEGKDLDEIFDNSDIAIGSLGLHRLNANKGSVLKVREYCARGIPFVIGYNDEDIISKIPYYYLVPADDSPINIVNMLKWYKKILSNNPNYTYELREFAEKHLSWKAKIKPLINRILEEKT
ncbi:MAG: hypothetical protein PWP54_1397 [Thermosipho sp. (in: thermotogales)]|nr:hypothetical protein [Thermosipho sp. (in: thermotogales)]MDK2900126.1 hypothetical protein [Thermosipho sp. (in: thermotogales)]